MSSLSSPKPPKKPQAGSDNFLEALRGLGKGIIDETKTQVRQAVTADIPDAFGLSTSGTIRPHESFSMADMQAAENSGEQKAQMRFANELRRIQEEDHARLLREEAQTKEQIKAIQQEIRALASSAAGLMEQVEVAAFQAPAHPGIYHRNFFTHLRLIIKSLRQKIDSSRNWLAESNSRAAKRSSYWGQVKTSGTKFMLSSERYMVTSTG